MNNSVRTTTLLNGTEISHHINVYYLQGNELDAIFFNENEVLTVRRKRILFSTRMWKENAGNLNAIKLLSLFRGRIIEPQRLNSFGTFKMHNSAKWQKLYTLRLRTNHYESVNEDSTCVHLNQRTVLHKPCQRGSSRTALLFSIPAWPTSVSSFSMACNSRISYTGCLRSWGPWANAQCGPFFTQYPRVSVSWTQVAVL